ncbi:hypothetical protein OKW41_004206 [Paraburkholderia sp. UCT70]|uniref:hypothetical protein n=1 Tax=Paraburkholderia sp. UCT70 TaxID=2991068 RepID=UPI003D1CF37F
MGLLDKAVHGVFKDIGEAVEGVAKGVGKIVEGGAELAAGALTLNPKEMAAGGKNLVTGGIKTASCAVELTPEGLESSAANNLLDGALEECGIKSGKDEEEGDDDGISLEDLAGTKEFCEKLPAGMKPGFLKV